MKGRSKRTAHREVERIGHKQARQAERQALHGGRVKVVRSEHWSNNIEQPTLPDEPARYPKKKSKSRKKKEVKWCPGREGRKRHEYLEDYREVTTEVWRGFWADPEVEMVIGFIRYRICVHCDKEQVFKPGKGYKYNRKRWITIPSVDLLSYPESYFVPGPLV